MPLRVDDRGFGEEIFNTKAKETLGEKEDIPFPLQNSSHSRALDEARSVANQLISDKGELRLEKIPEIIATLEKKLYILSLKRQWDTVFRLGLKEKLELLFRDKELIQSLRKISKPVNHKVLEKVIRTALQIPSKEAITDAAAKRAVLSAWFFPLRQSVGSCFATAPAIRIQAEEPRAFFEDMQEILATGRLKRTFGGIEYQAPLSPSFAGGDLRAPTVIPGGALDPQFPFHTSKALLKALFQSGIIDSQDPQAVLELINKYLKSFNQPWLLLTIEKLIEGIVLARFDISREAWEAFKRSPKEIVEAKGLFFSQKASSGKTKSLERIYDMFDEACRIFFSFENHALLRAWEYTIASFAETKASFAKWNLYSSLGFDPREPGGIGEGIWKFLEKKIEECNREVRRLQEDYERAYHQIQYLQARIKGASSEEEARWIRAEYQSKANEFYSLEEMRNKTHAKAEKTSRLFDHLVDFYNDQFPRYFQEVYDPTMHQVDVGPFDDAPAGFRLLYKHGRSSTSLWTLIFSPEEFQESLASFFIATETELAGAPFVAGLEGDIGQIVTQIVSHVRSIEFLTTSFDRMARVHGREPVDKPLENLEKIDKKPWAYTSGGVIETLLACYYRREEPPREISRWVESPIELLVFLVDTLKAESVDEDRSLLMHSPTHAFLLKPGWEGLKEYWSARDYTYTQIRDWYVLPSEAEVSQILLDQEALSFLVERVSDLVPVVQRAYFKGLFSGLGGPLLAQDFRSLVVSELNDNFMLSEEEVDSALFSLLPLCPSREIRRRVAEVLRELSVWQEGWQESLEAIFDEVIPSHFKSPFVGSVDLVDIVFGVLILVSGTFHFGEDIPKEVVRLMRGKKWLLPEPIVCADTNWAGEYFAFLVSPGTAKLQLWRCDPLGLSGRPMTSWKMWLDGSRKSPKWGVFLG